jgi:hypothetical protein
MALYEEWRYIDCSLYCHVSYYRVIVLDVSPISIHRRHAKSERVSDYNTHPRRTLKVHVTDLFPGWGPL